MMRRVPLNLPPQASAQAFLARLQALGLKPYRALPDPLAADVDALLARAVPHAIQQGIPPATVMVSVKVATIESVVDDNGEIVGWLYRED